MKFEKLFETNTLVFRQAYQEGNLEKARKMALEEVKEERFGNIENWRRQYSEHMDVFVTFFFGGGFIFIIQLAIFLLIQKTFQCPMQWANYVWIAECFIFIVGGLIYGNIEKEGNDVIAACIICLGSASGLISLMGLWAVCMALFVDKKQMNKYLKNYEKGPLAYCMMVYPNENVQHGWLFKECKAKVLEVNAKKECLAHLFIAKEIDEWEKKRQKKLKWYKDWRDILMWSKIVVIGIWLLTCFLGYRGIVYIDMTPNFIGRSIIILVIYYLFMSFCQNKMASKYQDLLNKEIAVPEIYKVYFYEE